MKQGAPKGGCFDSTDAEHRLAAGGAVDDAGFRCGRSRWGELEGKGGRKIEGRKISNLAFLGESFRITAAVQGGGGGRRSRPRGEVRARKLLRLRKRMKPATE
jgi:hypothetical protein